MNGAERDYTRRLEQALTDTRHQLKLAEAESVWLLTELEQIAAYVEPHYRGAGLTPRADWIIEQVAHRTEQNDDGEVERLREALERTLHNFELLLARKPVRDARETIAEARAALRGEEES